MAVAVQGEVGREPALWAVAKPEAVLPRPLREHLARILVRRSGNVPNDYRL